MSDAKEVKDWIVMNLGGTAEWRREKARQYPDDKRNLKAAAELDRLCESLEKLPNDDAALLRLAAAWANIYNDGGDSGLKYCEAESELLRDIGFYGAVKDGRELVMDLTFICQGIRDLADDE